MGLLQKLHFAFLDKNKLIRDDKMHGAIIETFSSILISYVAAYVIWLLYSIIRNGFDFKKKRINQDEKSNIKLVKGCYIGLILAFNLYIVNSLPETTIIALGKNENISEYIYFLLQLVIVETIIFALIHFSIDLSELNIGGLKLTQKEDIAFKHYVEKNDIMQQRLSSKIYSSNNIMHKLLPLSNGIVNALDINCDVEDTYIKEFEELMKFYIEKQDQHEANLEIKMHCINNQNYDIISSKYNVSKIKLSEVITCIQKEKYAVLDEKQYTRLLLEFESIFAGKYLIVISSCEKDVIIREEATIVDNIISAYDQFVYKTLK